MISRTWSRKSIALSLAVAILSVYSMVVLATPGQIGQTGTSGELSISGQVTGNGQLALTVAQHWPHPIVTDSGGVQEETTCLRVPCVTVRDNTERPVTIESGTNVIAGTTKESIKAAIRQQIVDVRRVSRFRRCPGSIRALESYHQRCAAAWLAFSTTPLRLPRRGGHTATTAP